MNKVAQLVHFQVSRQGNDLNALSRPLYLSANSAPSSPTLINHPLVFQYHSLFHLSPSPSLVSRHDFLCNNSPFLAKSNSFSNFHPPRLPFKARFLKESVLSLSTFSPLSPQSIYNHVSVPPSSESPLFSVTSHLIILKSSDRVDGSVTFKVTTNLLLLRGHCNDMVQCFLASPLTCTLSSPPLWAAPHADPLPQWLSILAGHQHPLGSILKTIMHGTQLQRPQFKGTGMEPRQHSSSSFPDESNGCLWLKTTALTHSS